jgi:HAD superfamily hydrolase (TIGR01509 family)
MTPHAFLAARTEPLALVIFDCDGVLVDSEPIAKRMTVAALAALGWEMSLEEAETRFLGMTLPDMVPIIEARIGRPVTAEWRRQLVADLVEAMANEAIAIPGAIETLHAVTALGLPWRIASNSSDEELQVKFARLGLTDLVAGRLHSFNGVARGKPAPDLFLAAAAAQGVGPAACVVIEDSVPGATAAAAAGMDCLGFAPHGDGALLRAVGAIPFSAMADLPSFLAGARRVAGFSPA